MEQERTPLSQENINAIMEKLRSYRRYDEEKLALIRSDLEWGLTKEETEQYTGRKYDIRQMRIYSNCLKKGCDKETLEVICAKGLGNSQMEVLYELYDKGVPVDVIRQIKEETNASPNRMKAALGIYQEKMEKASEHMDSATKEEDIRYANDLMAELRDIVSKINIQDGRFDELNQKLKQMESSKDAEAIRQDLINQISEKDQMISDKQDELNRALSKISSLRTENENLKAEIAKKNQTNEKISEDKPEASEVGVELKSEDERKDEEMGSEVAVNSIPVGVRGIGVGIPVYYQVAVDSGYGRKTTYTTIGNSERRSSGLFAVLEKIFFKKKSRADIVRLVSSGNLVPAQLVQIKNAIERGLTEEQLVELINNNLSPEKMKEIIEIAVLENGMSC